MRASLQAFFLSVSLPLSAFAQQGAPTPKKDPFAGFGNTALDRPTSGRTTPSPFNHSSFPSSAPTTASVPSSPGSAPASTSAGIALPVEWSGHITEGAGGQTRKMEDLRALLSAYGTAKKDTAPHPEALIYAGVAGESPVARPITYLMPLHEAETLLLRSRGIATISRAVAPGFPDGLFLHTYDARTGVAPFPNRITIMTDSAKPEPQVVAIELQNETQNWHPLHFKDIPRDWSTCDYLNTENRGQPGLVIKTRVDDRRRNGGYIVASMAFGNPPPVPTGWVRVAYRPAETATWYVPQPLIDLILYTLSQRLGQQPSPLGAGLGK